MRGDGFFEKNSFFEYLRMEGKGKRKRRMIVSGFFWDFFGMIFLLFAFIAVAVAFAFAVDVDGCSFFVARELMRTRGVGCGNASGPTSGT